MLAPLMFVRVLLICQHLFHVFHPLPMLQTACKDCAAVLLCACAKKSLHKEHEEHAQRHVPHKERPSYMPSGLSWMFAGRGAVVFLQGP